MHSLGSPCAGKSSYAGPRRFAITRAKWDSPRGCQSYFLFTDDRGPDPLRGSLVSSAIRCHVVKLRSACVFETGRNRHRKECAFQPTLHEAYPHRATGLLYRHNRETPPGRMHRMSCSFRSFLSRSSYPSFFCNESGMFLFPGEGFEPPAIPLYVERV